MPPLIRRTPGPDTCGDIRHAPAPAVMDLGESGIMLGESLLIFMHIPKTAGTTVGSHVKSNLKPFQWLSLYGIRRTREEITRQIADMNPESRNRIRFVLGHQVWFGIHELFERPPLYLTFVREPTSRVVSHYWHLAQNPESVHFRAIQSGEITLQSWLAGESNPHTINQMTRYLSRTSVGREPADKSATPVDRSGLRLAMDNLSQFWFVGLSAALNLDLPRMLNQLGLEPCGQDQRIGKRPPYQEYLPIDDRLLQISWERNWADHQLFSHATMLREQQWRISANDRPV